MKITCLFPIFKNDQPKKFFDYFLNTDFGKQKDVNLLCVMEQTNTQAIEYFKQLNSKKISLFLADKSFTYNDIFYPVIKDLDADVLLIGDVKIKNIDVLFNKCLELNKKGANVVQIMKKHNKFKTFFHNLFGKFYNLFVKLYTTSYDRLNEISLGLYDKDVIDIFKTLPNKCCFIKNTPYLKGFITKTIFVEDNIKTHKNNYLTPTTSLKAVIGSSVVFLLSLIGLILGNIFLTADKSTLNIITILIMILSLLIITFLIPKHFFDIRNTAKTSVNLQTYKLQKPKVKQNNLTQSTKQKKSNDRKVKPKSTTTKNKNAGTKKDKK